MHSVAALLGATVGRRLGVSDGCPMVGVGVGSLVFGSVLGLELGLELGLTLGAAVLGTGVEPSVGSVVG